MIEPTSRDQFEAALERRTPDLEEIRPGVWSIPLPLPVANEVESTLAYGIVADDGTVALIDPGWDTEENWVRVGSWLRSVGRTIDDIAVLAVTHLHRDHLGLALRIRDASGARLVLHEREQLVLATDVPADDHALLARWGVPADARRSLGRPVHGSFARPGVLADHLVADGDIVAIPGHDLLVVATPGHTPGHIAFVSPADHLVFTGDHVLPMIQSGLALGGAAHEDPLGDFLNSLAALAPYDDFEVAPGHWHRFAGLADRRAELAAHHTGRTAQIATILDESTSPTIWTIVERVTWTGGWDGLRALARRSALQQTEMHVRYLGRTSEVAT